MLKFSANLSFLYQELDFLDRFAAMYDMQNGGTAAAASMPSIGPISRSGRASVISIDPSITMTLMRFPRF